MYNPHVIFLLLHLSNVHKHVADFLTLISDLNFILMSHKSLLHCMLSLAAQCIVIAPVCLCVSVCLWVCYHDNSKLHASIFTKLGL